LKISRWRKNVRRIPRKRQRRNIVWKRFLPFLVFLCIFLYTSIRIVVYFSDSADTKQTNDMLEAMYAGSSENGVVSAETREPIDDVDDYQYVGTSLLPRMQTLYAKNNDLVAWLNIPGVVNLPVVYRDNSFYVDHDFYGKDSASGTLFLDESHPFRAGTQYLVIHGHNMHDGSMFGIVSHYLKKDYAQNHEKVYFSTLYREEQYSVCGVLLVSVNPDDDDYVPYAGKAFFRDAEGFMDFVSMLREHALYWNPAVQIVPTDVLLALSTCYEDRRAVVLCRRDS